MHRDTLSARSAALSSWAATRDRSARTAPARRALDEKFRTEARELLGDDATDDQVQASAAVLRRKHFTDLARRSARVRAGLPAA